MLGLFVLDLAEGMQSPCPRSTPGQMAEIPGFDGVASLKSNGLSAFFSVNEIQEAYILVWFLDERTFEMVWYPIRIIIIIISDIRTFW